MGQFRASCHGNLRGGRVMGCLVRGDWGRGESGFLNHTGRATRPRGADAFRKMLESRMNVKGVGKKQKAESRNRIGRSDGFFVCSEHGAGTLHGRPGARCSSHMMRPLFSLHPFTNLQDRITFSLCVSWRLCGEPFFKESAPRGRVALPGGWRSGIFCLFPNDR
jgi:hypothetical protein